MQCNAWDKMRIKEGFIRCVGSRVSSVIQGDKAISSSGEMFVELSSGEIDLPINKKITITVEE